MASVGGEIHAKNAFYGFLRKQKKLLPETAVLISIDTARLVDPKLEENDEVCRHEAEDLGGREKQEIDFIMELLSYITEELHIC